ncbi:MFS transporter [Marinomonas spartinae]|uniref:MFS transporter n=1 Tax=Marinomonas spartinae TaxID=1792290 RepID=UPI0018F2637D|nr:MFS transporter [Marinomonas spartinae]MBJ7552919.1 MFS transporter [Marinomonas spartinae]
MLLLFIIYIAFISLGLPDAVLGSSWPVMKNDLDASLEFAGGISFIISAGTVISSLYVTKAIHYLGIGKVVALSVLLTAVALLGFSIANMTVVLVFLAVPLGIGAGAVDAALNNFVALHYKAKHMNYLHSFWGVGATAGPLLMANFLAVKQGWRDGYMAIAVVQFLLVIVLFAALPLWKKFVVKPLESHETNSPLVSNISVLKMKGVSLQMSVFFCYCSIEMSTGLWSASYLTTEKNILPSTAAFWVAMYYLGITAGRFACGLIAEKIAEETLIRSGGLIILFGCLLLALPFSSALAKIGLILIGLGCASIFPNTIHMTPKRFGSSASQAIIGLSMASAYVGLMLVPPVLGAVARFFTFASLPVILMIMTAIILLTTERLRRYRSI